MLLCRWVPREGRKAAQVGPGGPGKWGLGAARRGWSGTGYAVGGSASEVVVVAAAGVGRRQPLQPLLWDSGRAGAAAARMGGGCGVGASLLAPFCRKPRCLFEKVVA